MRFLAFILVLALTVGTVIALNSPLGPVPPIGRFLSPQEGVWQNADPAGKNFSVDLDFRYLGKSADVYVDDRLVPHVFAASEPDAFFVQGWLHARFRLWQMEFQTYAAAGRLSEILGPGPDNAYLNNDRSMRRLGMVWAAEHTLDLMMTDEDTKKEIDAYTEGVNSYIGSLTRSDLPVEYRLLNYLPEKWTNLKTALFVKYMSYDLAGSESDIEYTNARSFFSPEDFRKLYPLFADSLSPIAPKGTVYPQPSITIIKPNDSGSHSSIPAAILQDKPDRDNGSNNWAVSGFKTKSGRPILCNDPHLGLNLPSLWYEMQISTPEHNTYGVSFPGAPSIVIGFNDSIAWGVTNAARDVRDYYQITFQDTSRTKYLFNKSWKEAEMRSEQYRMKDGSVITETVAYTVFGPVMYDANYSGRGRTKAGVNLAVKWKAHEPSNELKTFILLDRAKNERDYENAIAPYQCPGQNFVFASKQNHIAIWQQGSFPAKWTGQGTFIMPGHDSVYRWQANIPHAENPHSIDPERGFVSSANQLPADSSYPYYLGGSYDVFRALTINRYLGNFSSITTADMQKMQTDNYNAFAAESVPLFLRYIDANALSPEEKKYLEMIRQWRFYNDNEENAATIFTLWNDSLQHAVWSDELAGQPQPAVMPDQVTLIEALIRDPAFSFIDDVRTPEKETLSEVLTATFKKVVPVLASLESSDKLSWTRYKDAGIRHLLRIEPLSRFHLNTGGGVNVINATKQFHGPSWRMVVQLTDSTEAYGVYPGGQNGNPGSRFYDNFVDSWASGHYYPLWMMKKEDSQQERIIATIHFSNE